MKISRPVWEGGIGILGVEAYVLFQPIAIESVSPTRYIEFLESLSFLILFSDLKNKLIFSTKNNTNI